MSYGKTIKIFFPDGNPASLRIVDISNWTGRALTVYKIHLQKLLDRSDISKPGVYFLIGYDNNTGKNSIYIGETDDFSKRIMQHQNREDWNQCIVFLRKDDSLNKAHVKFLEKVIYDELNEASRVTVINDSSPSGAQLDEFESADMQEFKDNIYLILGCIGFPSINIKNDDESTQQSGEIIYYLNIKEANAKMRSTASGYILLKGSMICEDTEKGRGDPVMRGTYRQRDESFKNNRSIVEKEGKFYLTEDIVFSSPSAAAQFVYGNAINGRERWKTKDNKSLNQIENLNFK